MPRQPHSPRRTAVEAVVDPSGELITLYLPGSFLRTGQAIPAPGPGANAVGYVRLLSSPKEPESLEQQKRLIQDYIEQHGWQLVGWYEELEPSAAAEDRAPRPIFSRLLAEAGKDFQVVVCARNPYWSQNVPEAFSALKRLCQKQVWWATADGVWDLDRVVNEGFDLCITYALPRLKRFKFASDEPAKEKLGGR